MYVKNWAWWESLIWTRSSTSILSFGRSQLHCSISRWSGLHDRASIFSCFAQSGGFLSDVSPVCVDVSDVFACLSRMGQHILKQANTAHIINRGILQSVISPFILKPGSHWTVRHHIQYESKTFKEVSLLTTKFEVEEKHKVMLHSWYYQLNMSYVSSISPH